MFTLHVGVGTVILLFLILLGIFEIFQNEKMLIPKMNPFSLSLQPSDCSKPQATPPLTRIIAVASWLVHLFLPFSHRTLPTRYLD